MYQIIINRLDDNGILNRESQIISDEKDAIDYSIITFTSNKNVLSTRIYNINDKIKKIMEFNRTPFATN